MLLLSPAFPTEPFCGGLQLDVQGEDDDSDAARLAAIRDSEERTNCTLTNMEDKFADMEKKIDELTGMLQTLLEKE